VSGIVDMAESNPLMVSDYLDREDAAEIKIKPDKTYTLLHGSVGEIQYDPALLSGKYSREEFEAPYQRGKNPGACICQSVAAIKNCLPGRIQCILGATADGSTEYDEARFMQSIDAIIQNLEEPADSRIRFFQLARQKWVDANGRLNALPQHESCKGVSRKVFGNDIDIYVVDTGARRRSTPSIWE
jgi:hypothetical protein